MKRERILLVDTSAILHVVKHSGKKQIKKKDLPVYILYGFLVRLQLLMKKTKSDVCVFANDGPSHESLRLKIYPSYKEKRNDKSQLSEEEIAFNSNAYAQFNEVKNEILPMLGYSNIFATKGLEADDIIGRICKQYSHCEIFIVTTDEDMYQLLSNTVCIVNAKTNQYFSKKMFEAKYGIPPHYWKRVKAIGGCSSDEVRGVPIPQSDPNKKQLHVAAKGALNYLKGKMFQTTKAFQAIESRAGKDIINRNKALVILPFWSTPDYFIEEDRISKIKIQGMAKRYGFKGIESDIETWYKTLKGWN